jgi:hypothetical protein
MHFISDISQIGRLKASHHLRPFEIYSEDVSRNAKLCSHAHTHIYIIFDQDDDSDPPDAAIPSAYAELPAR